MIQHSKEQRAAEDEIQKARAKEALMPNRIHSSFGQSGSMLSKSINQ